MPVSDLYEAACLQDIGGRKEQQDRVAILWSDAACLVVLADGLGGHIDGAFAAQTAVDVGKKVFGADPLADPTELFQAIITDAHSRINAGAKLDEAYYPRNYPGSTCVLLHLTPSMASWTHLGDSRFYHCQGGACVVHTTDHSYGGGGMYACLGADLQLPSLIVATAPMPSNDVFVLCSDGLWENLPDDEHYLGDVLQGHHGDLGAGLRVLVSSARARGGERCDNISVAAVRLARPER